jgi:predicted protein tyrosine phosphatase
VSVTLIVCGLSDIHGVIARRRPSHMVTLLDPSTMIETPAGLSPQAHLKLGVNDIAAPTDGMIPPDESSVQQLLEFGRAWDETHPMLIHCWAGISRSTASAFVIACDKSPDADETEMALAMRRAARHAYPNRRIIAIADSMLGRGGRMIDAVEAMGSTDYAVSGVYENVGHPFDFAARH